ncbi:cytochrome P450 [Kineosporia babensis]|uniref:Cytochrome P450 n=1 Tax=Kineosporia babensis TaxID=499548 RepID=A0A9X1NM01_9ACTN|nr:cytochrome P450 [Kineosporia babensis]MCD5316024.1 cytochrome P450 [Kineosporia babensis]
MTLPLRSEDLALLRPWFDPFDPGLHEDPYSRYERAREATPVCPGPYGLRVFTRHRDVSAALRDNRLGHGEPTSEKRIFSFLGQDPPGHGPLRRLAAQFLGPQAISALEPRIAGYVDELLEVMLAQRSADVLTDFAYPLSLRVIGSLFAIPQADQPWIRAQTPPIGRLLDPPYSISEADRTAARKAAAVLVAYLHQKIGERRRSPGPDVLSALIAAADSGGSFTRRELIPMCSLLLLAGYETTANIIANAVLALLEHPQQLRQARSRLVDGQLVPRAVDELARYDSSVQVTFRTVQARARLGGVELAEGERVALLIGSANRDPRVFERPDQLDLDRSPNPHLSFGAGIHYCLGSPLARLETGVALGRLLQRSRSIELDSDRLRHKNLAATLRGLEALPVRVTAA